MITGLLQSDINLNKISKERWCVFGIMCIAVLSRAVGIGFFPGGVNVDEAFSGYEAWAILNYGTDSWRVHNPVYLTVWGSGMSVLNSILMMPFICLFGLNTITIRLPQMLIGVVSVYVFYLLLKMISNSEMALWGMFFLAICPWHIMMSRVGMDCNLAPGFMLFAVYFFIKGLDKEPYLIISALFWGLSLYCYATIWILAPPIIIGWGGYCFKHKKIACSKYIFAFMSILFLLALPLLLFIAVNMGWIEEIRTGFLSVPRLVCFRSDELGMANLVNNVKSLFKLFIRQNDGLIWNVIPYFGMYYLFTMPFAMLGFFLYGYKTLKCINDKKFGYEFLIIIWLFASVVTGILQGINVNKINYIHIPMIILWAKGVWWICAKLKRKYYIGKIIAIVYLVSFFCFEEYYYTVYQEEISERQLAGADKAIEQALRLKTERGIETIVVPNVLRHSQVLFFTKWPLENYLETVQWQEYPARWLKADSFGCFEWIREEEQFEGSELEKDKIYLLILEEKERFTNEGWHVEMYDYVGTAYYED